MAEKATTHDLYEIHRHPLSLKNIYIIQKYIIVNRPSQRQIRKQIEVETKFNKGLEDGGVYFSKAIAETCKLNLFYEIIVNKR